MNYILHVLYNELYIVMGLVKYPLGIYLSKGHLKVLSTDWFYQLKILDVIFANITAHNANIKQYT